MSKASLNSMTVVRKGEASPPSSTGSKDVSFQGDKEESKEPRNEASSQGRKRAWHQPGQDEWKKTNYEMPLRVQTKLKEMKNWGYLPNVYSFVAETVEREIDKIIAKAEKDGF